MPRKKAAKAKKDDPSPGSDEPMNDTTTTGTRAASKENAPPSGGPAVEGLLSKLPENRFELEVRAFNVQSLIFIFWLVLCFVSQEPRPVSNSQLEFIQSLASPAYLHYLATSNYLTDPAFLAYLRYLQYWRQPPYNRFLTYPHCLTFLDLLLTNETFRRELNSVQFRNFLHEQQFYSWQYRSRHLYGGGGGNENNAGKEDGADANVSGAAAPGEG